MQNIGGKSQEYLNYSIDILKWKMIRKYKLFPAYSVPEKWSEYLNFYNFWPRIGYIFWGTYFSGVLKFLGYLNFWGAYFSWLSPCTRMMQDARNAHDVTQCDTNDVMWTMWCTRCDTRDAHDMTQCDARDAGITSHASHHVIRVSAHHITGITSFASHCVSLASHHVTSCASPASHHITSCASLASHCITSCALPASHRACRMRPWHHLMSCHAWHDALVAGVTSCVSHFLHHIMCVMGITSCASWALWIYFEESTSSMHATVLLQTVYNALVRGQRLFLTMSQVCQLEGGFWWGG